MMVSSTLKLAPLLFWLSVPPPAEVITTSKDEIEVSAGILVEKPKNTKVSSKPLALPL